MAYYLYGTRGDETPEIPPTSIAKARSVAIYRLENHYFRGHIRIFTRRVGDKWQMERAWVGTVIQKDGTYRWVPADNKGLRYQYPIAAEQLNKDGTIKKRK